MSDPNLTSEVAAALAAVEKNLPASERVVDVSSQEGAEGVPVAILPQGMTARVLTDALEVEDKRAPAPRRRKGTAKHQELDSFIAHVNRFKDKDSAIFANNDEVTVTAVLDYHPADGVRWGEHRSVYECPLSDKWKLWTDKNGIVFSQDQFGEFIDANMADLASPSAGGPVSQDVAEPAAVLQMARNLSVIQRGEFTRVVNPTDGTMSLVNKSENDTGSTKIPRAFLLQLPVFENGALYAVEARIRFSMQGGRPNFAYVLYQPEKILQDAFGVVRKAVVDGTALPLFVGSPE